MEYSILTCLLIEETTPINKQEVCAQMSLKSELRSWMFCRRVLEGSKRSHSNDVLGEKIDMFVAPYPPCVVRAH